MVLSIWLRLAQGFNDKDICDNRKTLSEEWATARLTCSP